MNSTPTPTKLLDMLEGFSPISNLLGVGDPDIHKIDGQWQMFIGGFQTNFKNNIFSLSLPPGAPLSSNEWTFLTEEGNPCRAKPVIAQPPKEAWDGYGLHTPSYVRGTILGADGQHIPHERIYYAGRSSKTVTDNTSPYAIGCLENTPDGWVRHPAPIIQGTPESPNVLEPKVRFFEQKWRMWYVTTPQEAGKKAAPRYQIVYRESADGLTHWSEPQILFSADEGFYDAVVLKAQAGYEMVVCRSSNLYGRNPFPEQGLWLLRSKTPTGRREDWTAQPYSLLSINENTPDWYANGMFGPTIQYGDTPEDQDTLYIYFTAVQRKINWFSTTFRRLIRLKKPPVPAPYYFAIGRIQIERNQLEL